MKSASTIITTGSPYTDIDALACALAYGELMMLKDTEAQVVLPGPLNHSVTKAIRQWNLDFKASPTQDPDQIIIVDTSDPSVFPDFAGTEKIVQIFDHHPGNENFWQNKLGENAHIEDIGACASLIWEEFKKDGLAERLSETSANLLYTAIVSNTLNFKALITKDRDIQASEQLKKYTNLPPNWIAEYFEEQSAQVKLSPLESVDNDTKVVEISNLNMSLAIGQIELWNARDFISTDLESATKNLDGTGLPWFLTMVSIEEGKNYIYTTDQSVKSLLESALQAKFQNHLGQTDRLYLRKEIIKILLAT